MWENQNTDGRRRIAYFITAHGFGHAARACAVMQSILDRDPAIGFEIFTSVPEWFFRDSLYTAIGHPDIGYHPIETDIGMVQASPFEEDVAATLKRLKDLLPFDPRLIIDTADKIKQLECGIILCDIAPMGIAVADTAGVPSVLIENFTWDWIYSEYRSESKEFIPFIDYLEKYFRSATYHIKAEPFCQTGKPDLTVAPVSREPRSEAAALRTWLDVNRDAKIALLTMGGVSDRRDYAEGLEGLSDIHFIIPGAVPTQRRQDNITFLPYRSDFFHPDLIHAADAVIGKAGYSTIAEVYQAGKPFGYVTRPSFRESAALERFIQDHLTGLAISEEELNNRSWVKKIPDLLHMPAERRERKNGADEITRFILDLL